MGLHSMLCSLLFCCQFNFLSVNLLAAVWAVMGRPKQGRKRHYKSYWDKDGETDIPESTLRYKKRRMEDAWIVEVS